MRWLSGLLSVGVLAVVLWAGVPLPSGRGLDAREYLYERGRRETGAVNLVTSIYLGYRAFDTLGETVVLVLAIAGVSWFLREQP